MHRRLAVWICVQTVLLASQTPDFTKDVQPILSKYCSQCHGAAAKMGELDLRTPSAIFKGGTKGAAIEKGNTKASILYARIVDHSMPPGAKKVSAAEIETIRQWIDGGAPGESTNGGASAAVASRHWAFVTPQRPALPAVKQREWVRNPVDTFLVSLWEAKGLRPVRRADKLTLLRRVYLDLIGLPPTIEEQLAFEKDTSPLAYERVVDQLLTRPEYGQRWARHWLDVVRYAESNGYERDGTKPNVWRYRDYVVDSLNRDKPYDRFVVEQLAGDELEGSNAETQIATTFLRLGTWDDEPAEPMLDRYDQLDDVIGATSATFLGVTLRCARCHDHKFEPFTQKDYYRTLAIFNPLKRPQEDRKEFDRLAGTEAELAAYNKAKEEVDTAIAELRGKIEPIRREVLKRLFSEEGKKRHGESIGWVNHAETVLAFSTPADRRTKEQKKLVEAFNAKLDETILAEGTDDERTKLQSYKQEIARIDSARLKEPPRAYVWYEEGPTAPVTRLLVRGDPARPGDAVDPGVPSILGNLDASAVHPTRKSSGRRLSFAKWLVDPQNPLTARVIVNRLWQGHFGEGIVPSENDFGVAGQRPTNPALLDWLATELQASGWSLKHIHKLIVKSNAYQLSAEWDEQNGRIDPDSALGWRWKPRRLEAEAVRDMTLLVGGRLNPQLGGPSIYPKLPQAVLDGQSVPGSGWGKSEGDQASRRSIYIFSKRSLAVPELEMLDAPDTTSSCEQRSTSTTGPQALIFLNGDFTNAAAKDFAARLQREAPGELVNRAFRLAFSRPPTSAEVSAAQAFLSKTNQRVESFALALLNANEYFYLN